MATSSLERFLAYAVLGRKPARERVKLRRRGLLALGLKYVQFPERDERYKAYIRTLRCLICGKKPEAAHTGDDGGQSMKASDRSCVPLCDKCHRTGTNSYHRIGKRAFEVLHTIDLSAIVQRLNADYKR